jgi:hypothetical protein
MRLRLGLGRRNRSLLDHTEKQARKPGNVADKDRGVETASECKSSPRGTPQHGTLVTGTGENVHGLMASLEQKRLDCLVTGGQGLPGMIWQVMDASHRQKTNRA